MAGSGGSMVSRWRRSPAVLFYVTMTRSVPGLAWTWWALMALRALVPAGLAIATGVLVGRVASGGALTSALALFGVVFVVSQVAPPLHQSVGTLLGLRLSSVLNDRLMKATLSPQGVGHLERGDLMDDLTAARDFDLGLTGPPLFVGMDFLARSLVTMLGGVVSALVLFGFAWWAAPALLLAWGSTHWLLRESGVWRDRNTAEVRAARRHTDYAYDLATEPGPAKEVRLFGLAPWLLDRFTVNRLRLHELQYAATKLRERSLVGALTIVLVVNVGMLWLIAQRALNGGIGVTAVVTYAGAVFGASAIAFGGLSWALDGAAAPVAAIVALEPEMATSGRLRSGGRGPAPSGAAPEIRFREVTFTYPSGTRPVLEKFDLTIPAGASLAIVGQNGAGKSTIAKLLCRLYDPDSGRIEINGIDLRDLDLPSWRAHLAAVFQDFVRYELPLRDNVVWRAADEQPRDALVEQALAQAGALGLADLDAPMSKGYPGGVDLSGGQWQRVALARSLARVAAGADVVLLDEPTAMLDVRGESEIFGHVLDATADRTTILVSHRFSTVRQADLIAVVEHGRVIELGSHDALMAEQGRYRRMYDLQASRFVEVDDDGLVVVHDVL